MKNKKAIIWLIAVIVMALVATVVLIAVLNNRQTQDPTDTSPAAPMNPSEPTATTPTEPIETKPTDPVVNEPKDYDNGVVRKPTTVDKVILENDFSEVLDPLVKAEYQKTSYFGSTAALEDGWLHLTSTEHLFVYGTHLWGEYGGVSFNTGKTYSVSLDLKKGTGTEHSNEIFTLTLAEEAEDQDPRYGNQLKQVVIDFSNYDEMVAFNSDKGTFAHVVFKAETGICHIEVRFTVDRGAGNYLLYARDASGYNDWLIDNFNISEITEEGSEFDWNVADTQDTYDCEINTGRGSVTVWKELLNEHFNTQDSIKLENGGRTAFFGSSVALDNGMVCLTTNQHLFTFGAFKDWGYFGGVDFQKDHDYVMSFDLKLGDARTQKVFNLYVMQEDDPDPRFGTALYTLQLDFSDLYRQMNAGEENYFVKVNTNNFASVKYNSKTRIAHIEIRFTRTTDLNVQVVSKGTGDNEWLVDNMYIGDTTKPVEVVELDYDNSVNFDGFESTGTTFENDFSEDANKGVDQAWEQSAFFGSTAALQDGWVHVTSHEHVFVFGGHTWANYGSIAFDKDTYYKVSFDLKLGSNAANHTFNLYVMTENGDPRFGDIVKTLTLNYKDFKNFVTTNTDSFASVTYTAETHTAHIEILFKTDASKNTDIVSKCAGDNDWLMDNLKIEKMKYTCPGHVDTNNDGICDVCGQELVTVVEKDYSNGVTFDGFESTGTAFENDFSEDANKGVIQEWEKSAFMGSTAALRDGWVRITSNEHVFVFGGHTWGNFGSVSFAKDTYYKVSFDLKLGSDSANRTFNLYVMTENGDPRFGDIVKTLTLNFEDFENFVTTNTDSFASVTYTAETHTAHIEILFKTDASKNTDIVSKCAGDNDWLMDNLKIEKMKYTCPGHVDTNNDGICDVCGQELVTVVEKDYSNGVTFDGFESTGTAFENDFSEDANKGVDQAWEKSAFMGSTAALRDGWVRITSNEHVFVFGGHTWGNFGSVSFAKDAYYKVSFDLKLGSDSANRTFNLYVMTENGDPRFGDIVKTLTLNFEDFENFVTANTDSFASVTYTAETHTAHIEILFKTDASKHTDMVSRCAGDNDWLMDNLKIETMKEVQAEKDYSNGVTFDGFESTGTTFENDFSEDANKGVDQAWEKSAFNGSTASLQDGWVRITSEEHVFVFGGHTWAFYGGVSFDKDAYYKVSFDLKLGSDSANRTFNLYVMTENGDPRFGDIVKTLTLNFEDFENFVTTNTDSFASVTYTAETHTAHIEILFKTDASLNTDIVSRCVGQNDWLMDNLKIETMEEVQAEKDYSNGVTFDGFTSTGTTFENDFSEDANKGVDQAWEKSAFNGSTASLQDGWARITSDEHVFVFGGHAWGNFGSVSFGKDAYYKVSFDLKLGSDSANRTFNLYVMTENGDPRFGDIVKTLTLNFEDFENFVTANTDSFASVTYTAETHTAHIEILFKTDASLNTDIVSRCVGQNDWLMDNLKMETMEEVQAEKDYSNGVTFDGFESTGTTFENDFSEDANKGVDQAWEKSAFNGSTASLQDGWVRITSEEHVFVFGGHAWGNYGGVSFGKDAYYKVSFDLKLGSDSANRTFNLYVMTENGDPRFGDIVKTLTLNFEDFEHFVTTNTDSFASVTYTAETQTAHIEILFKTDASLNTDIVSRCVGQNDWLMDNLKIETCIYSEEGTSGLGFTALLALPAVIGKFRFGTV